MTMQTWTYSHSDFINIKTCACVVCSGVRLYVANMYVYVCARMFKCAFVNLSIRAQKHSRFYKKALFAAYHYSRSNQAIYKRTAFLLSQTPNMVCLDMILFSCVCMNILCSVCNSDTWRTPHHPRNCSHTSSMTGHTGDTFSMHLKQTKHLVKSI